MSRIALSAICVAYFSGCSALDLFPWSRTESSEQAAESFQNTKLVFKLPEDRLAKIKSIEAASQYPYQAPEIRLPSPRLEVNHEVRRELSNYLRNNAHCISLGLARQENLFPVLAKIFHDEGLPEELLNLALIESSFRVDAQSSAGAVGLWQFMASTARLYGLEVSRKVDERKDPILSTMAAARHLKELYSKYNDWYLVLAAYNAGEGAIDKAGSGLARSDYWSMVRAGRVATETSRFVPKFIAASILQKLYQHYGNRVQLAQYIDRHVTAVGSAGSDKRFAFSIEGASIVKRG